jgi:hypothetical protein
MHKFLLVLALFTSSCVIVNGRIRPQWDSGEWKIICKESAIAAAQIEFKIYDDHGRTLPGASILVIDSLKSQHQLFAQNDGAAVFISDGGKFEATIELEGFKSRNVSIEQPTSNTCTVEVYLVLKSSEPLVSTVKQNENRAAANNALHRTLTASSLAHPRVRAGEFEG